MRNFCYWGTKSSDSYENTSTLAMFTPKWVYFVKLSLSRGTWPYISKFKVIESVAIELYCRTVWNE